MKTWLHAAACGLLLVTLSAGARAEPRLFLTANELVEFRHKIEQPPFAARWQRLLANADWWVAHPEHPNLESINLSRRSLGIIGVCSFAHLVTNDPRYAARAKEEAYVLLARKAWFEVRVWNKGAELPTSECSLACALFLDWCGDMLSADERTYVESRLLELGITPYLASVEKYHDFWVGNPLTNWGGVCNGGCGMAALVLRDRYPEAERAYHHARRHIFEFLHSAIGVDGEGHEGVMYWRYGTQLALYFLTAANHADPGPDLDATLQLLTDRHAGYWAIALQGPDGRYANFNDMNEDVYAGLYSEDETNWEGGPDGPLSALLERCAAKTLPEGASDSLLLWAADHGGGPNYFRGTSPFWFLWRRSIPPGPEQKPELPDSLLFRTNGHTIWRTPDLWFAFNGGAITERICHYNSDLGSFMLVYKGERFVADPGYGVLNTADHSTVTINGKNQPRGVRARYAAWQTAAKYRYLLCDLSTCYSEDLAYFHRHVVLVDNRFLVLVDDLSSYHPADYDSRIATRLPIALAGQSAEIKGQHATLHVVSAAPTDAVVSTGKSTIDFVSVAPRERTANCRFVTVLYPDEPGSKPPVVSVQDDATHLRIEIKTTAGDAHLTFRPDRPLWLTEVNGESCGPNTVPQDRTWSRLISAR